MVPLSIGQKLKAIKDAKRLKQKDFAEILGIKQSNVSDYINEKVIPHDRTLKDIINICQEEFGLNIDWWNTGEGEMFLPNLEIVRSFKTVKIEGNNNRMTSDPKHTSRPEPNMAGLQNKLDSCQQEVQFLRDALRMKDDIIKSKDDLIQQLRTQSNRANN